MLAVGNVFAPQLSLSTEHPFGLLGVERRRDRLELVNLLQRYIPADGLWLGLCRSLVVVEISVRGGGHNHIVPGLGGGDTTGLSTPAHYHRPRCQATLKDLVPTDQQPTVTCQERIHLLDEPAMELGLILQAQPKDQCLHFLTSFPVVLVRFVPANVNISAWK